MAEIMDYQTRRNLVMDSIQPSTFAPEKFPLAYKFYKRSGGWFDKALTSVSEAVVAGKISNVAFQDAKTTINRALEEAYKGHYNERFTYAGKYKELPADFDEKAPQFPALHILGGAIKKALNLPDHPAKTAILEVLREFEPLAEAVNSLKDKVVKRQPGPTTEQKKAAALIPKTERSAAVKKVIHDAVETMRPGLVKEHKEWRTKTFNAAVEAFGPSIKPPSWREEEAYKRYANFMNHLSRILVAARSDKDVARIDAVALDKEANRYVDDLFAAVAIKMMEKAGQMDKPKVIKLGSHEFTLQGEIKGAVVMIEQNIIFNYSVLGKPFNQFPARIYVSGKFMSEAAYKTWMLAQ